VDQCHYEVNVKTIKEEMVRRISKLEQEKAELQASIEEQKRSKQEKEREIEQREREKDLWILGMFNTLTKDERGPEIAERLRAGQSYKQIVEWLGVAPFGGVTQLSPTSASRLSQIAKNANFSAALDMDLDRTPDSQRPFKWTNVELSKKQVHHLMALYFTWIHPVHMLFSEKHFMHSFETGSPLYCSSPLLNAICSMGCFFLTEGDIQGMSAKTLRSRFVDEVQKGIGFEDRTKPTFASTYAILFLIGISSGQARKASAYLRLAAESILNATSSNYATEALEITSWGIHTLNIEWAGFTYQKPFAPKPLKATVFKDVALDNETAFWQPYRSPTDNATSEVPSYAIQTAKQLAGLNMIIMNTINVYCGSRGAVTAHSILKLYRNFLEWKANLPSVLEVKADDSQKLPHIYFLHAHYHVALCQLFQPLLYHGFPQATLDHIKRITVQTAMNGLKVLEAYERLFSNRYQVALQLFCLVHICDTLVRLGPAEINKPELVRFCLRGLHEALPYFSFVGPLQYMFLQAAGEQGVVIAKDIPELMGGRTQYGPEELLDACERVTYSQPIEILLQRFDPSIAADFEHEWHEFIEAHGGSDDMGEGDNQDLHGMALSLQQAGGRSMEIGSFVNP